MQLKEENITKERREKFETTSIKLSFIYLLLYACVISYGRCYNLGSIFLKRIVNHFESRVMRRIWVS